MKQKFLFNKATGSFYIISKETDKAYTTYHNPLISNHIQKDMVGDSLALVEFDGEMTPSLEALTGGLGASRIDDLPEGRTKDL